MEANEWLRFLAEASTAIAAGTAERAEKCESDLARWLEIPAFQRKSNEDKALTLQFAAETRHWQWQAQVALQRSPVLWTVEVDASGDVALAVGAA